jgi:hypothetical protein
MVEAGVLKEEAVRLKEQAVVLNKNLEMMKKTVEELERKRKVQKQVTDAHDAIRMYNKVGWDKQADKVKRIKAICDEPLFNDSFDDSFDDEMN